MKPKQARTTWTIEPDAQASSLMEKAMNRVAGRKGDKRGLRTRLILEALKLHLASLAGKREGALQIHKSSLKLKPSNLKYLRKESRAKHQPMGELVDEVLDLRQKYKYWPPSHPGNSLIPKQS